MNDCGIGISSTWWSLSLVWTILRLCSKTLRWRLRSNHWLFWGYLHWKVSSKLTLKGNFFAHPLWNMLLRTFNETASWITLSWDGSTCLIYLVKEGFPCTVMIGAVKEAQWWLGQWRRKWVIVSVSWPQ